ncbi:MAG: hypothetical protein K2J89_05240 [Clostridia bacterium]|nr:hypothetical protein [Clostridia bacterium]
MRKLSIKRKWSIIECASKIYLYVQCPEEEKTYKIDGIACKQIGLFKNGKTVELDIWEEETEVFVVSSTMQASFTVPAGTDNVSLLAVPSYNPMQGNPFKISELK